MDWANSKSHVPAGGAQLHLTLAQHSTAQHPREQPWTSMSMTAGALFYARTSPARVLLPPFPSTHLPVPRVRLQRGAALPLPLPLPFLLLLSCLPLIRLNILPVHCLCCKLGHTLAPHIHRLDLWRVVCRGRQQCGTKPCKWELSGMPVPSSRWQTGASKRRPALPDM